MTEVMSLQVPSGFVDLSTEEMQYDGCGQWISNYVYKDGNTLHYFLGYELFDRVKNFLYGTGASMCIVGGVMAATGIGAAPGGVIAGIGSILGGVVGLTDAAIGVTKMYFYT